MQEESIEDHHAVMVPEITIDVNGTTWDYQEFCQHMARNLEFLGSRPGFRLERYPDMEGMETVWELRERTGTFLGPALTFSNLRNAWVGCNPRDEFKIVYLAVGADPLFKAKNTLASV
jgi:hypothetical protein